MRDIAKEYEELLRQNRDKVMRLVTELREAKKEGIELLEAFNANK